MQEVYCGTCGLSVNIDSRGTTFLLLTCGMLLVSVLF